tara:strand:- start:3651 stop:5171 length:1521 start_codon:yes stop_codon:yes gene_type:complete
MFFEVNNNKSFLSYVLSSLVIILILNWVSQDLFIRFDLTDNKMFSLSDSSKSVVKKLNEKLTMKVYFSDDLPGEYGNNRRYLQDMVEEYASYSKNIKYEFYKPETDEDLEEEAQSYGISPVQLQVIENDNLAIKKVYMGMVFLYADDRETIPVIQSAGLEYNITTIIKRMTESNKQSIGIADFSNSESKNENISELLKQNYNLQNVNLVNPISDNIQALILSGITDSLLQEEINHLENYINRGGGLFVAQNRISTDLTTQSAETIQSNVYSFLEKYGLGIKENLVMDKICGSISVLQNRGIFRMQTQMEYPFFPMIRTFAEDQVLVSGLEQVRVMFPSEVFSFVDSLGLYSNIKSNFSPLMFSSDNSGSMEQFFNLSPANNAAFSTLKEKNKIVAAKSEVFINDTLSSNIILLGDSNFISDDVGGGIQENTDLVLNAIDFLMGDEELVSLRSRKVTTRPLEEISDGTRKLWKWSNRLVPFIIVLLIALFKFNSEKMRESRLRREFR